MTQYAVADIGSNTMVLVIYELHDGLPVQIYHESTPAHLIEHVNDQGQMSLQGIQKAYEVLKTYQQICDENNISFRWADITEPCRIQNQKTLVEALSGCSFEIYPLTGYEEASCDYIGSKNSWSEPKDGIAFDVGGGSTELIAFQNGEILDALSFHLGCVRLAHLPLDTQECREQLLIAQKDHPAFQTSSAQLIGIGGTMRAAGLVADALYHTGNTVSCCTLQQLYTDLVNNDPTALEAMLQNVRESRQPVFLPGMHMILEICTLFAAKTILISDSGIREGFLQMCIDKHKVIK
ncbi:MAG: hypothetical protein LKF53_00815 [Solobacterium sp.]|jgi:exopolyphosphatase/guanosine-5'-triphosphate,3'-diphosphate pyrophosphatase|nr:hypothetical protein [Solobacterium sp.]MCH4204918.1 hypothetical protein [Solobacterium sp.]MCH4226310.1 hypothetical protein [Solobacterium sp.]MCH4281711.1 hypothetical protein [Solobacterium sp.]